LLALAMSTVAIAAGGTAASAATDGGPIMPASAQPTTKTLNADYSCDFSAYGGGTSTVPLAAVISAPSSATAGSSVYASFSTEEVTFPSSVSSNATMQTVSDFSFSAATDVNDAGAQAAVSLKSFTTPEILIKPTGIPATLPNTTNVNLQRAGTAVIPEPITVVITPNNAQGTPLTPIKCSLTTPAVVDLVITVNAPVTTPTGPVYSCAVTFDGHNLGSETAPIPMSVSASGSRTTGSTDAITLSSPGSGLGGPYPSGTTSVAFSGSLPVSGAQQGSIALYRRTSDVASSTFTVTGDLFLTKPGADTIRLPKTFTFSLYGPKGEPPIVLSCESKSSTPQVGLTLTVTGKAVQPPAAQGSATPVPSTTATGTPVGAPNTGGGRPASGLPLIAGGIALLGLGGAGLTIAARKRRQGQSLS
jgi:hypothetical protein